MCRILHLAVTFHKEIQLTKDIEFVRNTLEYALSEINRTSGVTEATLRNLKIAVEKLEGRPDFVEDHPAHHEEKKS